MRKIWIYTKFKGNKIERVELYGSVQKIVDSETITDNGVILDAKKLQYRLTKSVKCKSTENRMFESDDYSIIERPIKRAKMRRKEFYKE